MFMFMQYNVKVSHIKYKVLNIQQSLLPKTATKIFILKLTK